MLDKFRAFTQSFKKYLQQSRERQAYIPRYRLVNIKKINEEHVVTIQVVHKNVVFDVKPEEILARDQLVNYFSPTDVRTLTYLGYLGINGPQYKILAQRLSLEQDKMVFALQKKGDKTILLKTADEMMREKEIIEKLSCKDANLVGYVTATEQIQSEKNQKNSL